MFFEFQKTMNHLPWILALISFSSEIIQHKASPFCFFAPRFGFSSLVSASGNDIHENMCYMLKACIMFHPWWHVDVLQLIIFLFRDHFHKTCVEDISSSSLFVYIFIYKFNTSFKTFNSIFQESSMLPSRRIPYEELTRNVFFSKCCKILQKHAFSVT